MRYISTLLTLTTLTLLGCADVPDPPSVERDAPDTEREEGFNGKADGLPVRDHGVGLPSARTDFPWGGPDPALWQPEAIVANAASRRLNLKWGNAGVVEVVVAIPVEMQSSALHPFGDGQSNGAPSFGGWSHSAPPMVATLMTLEDGRRMVEILLHDALEVPSEAVEVLRDGASIATLPLQPGSDGRVAVWQIPAEGFEWDAPTPPALIVRPAGWQDGFPLSFTHPIRSAETLAASLPATSDAFADGRAFPDPESLSLLAAPEDDRTVFERTQAHSFGDGYDAVPFHTAHVHGELPGRATSATAVGQAWTWLAEPPVAPFKHIYICFEARNKGMESVFGVPSGSGWHAIGDPAESLLNSLEGSPILAGWARTSPVPAAPGGGFPWGLSDVATLRLLQPGESLVTARSLEAGEATYHWYAVHQAQNICVEIWVHPCDPGDGLTFSCEDEPVANNTVTFEVEAQTRWGEAIYVVGDHPALGGWSPDAALPLSPARYPLWSASVDIAAGTAVRYKFIAIDEGGGVRWEGGPDRTLTVLEGGATVVGSFR